MIARVRRRLAAAIVAVLCTAGFAFVTPAAAVADDAKCSFSTSNVTFGTIDIAAATPPEATATFTYSCTGDPGQIIRICPSFGLDATPRTMTDSAGHKLRYDLYTDGGHHVVWGTWFGNPPGPTLDVPLNGSGTGVGSAIIFAQIVAGQTDVPPGSYQQGFGGNHTSVGYAYARSAGSCSGIAHVHYDQASFTAGAIVK